MCYSIDVITDVALYRVNFWFQRDHDGRCENIRMCPVYSAAAIFSIIPLIFRFLTTVATLAVPHRYHAWVHFYFLLCDAFMSDFLRSTVFCVPDMRLKFKLPNKQTNKQTSKQTNRAFLLRAPYSPSRANNVDRGIGG